LILLNVIILIMPQYFRVIDIFSNRIQGVSCLQTFIFQIRTYYLYCIYFKLLFYSNICNILFFNLFVESFDVSSSKSEFR